MSTRHLVDPELLPVLDMMPSMQASAETLPVSRGRIAEMTTMVRAMERDPEVDISDHQAPGYEGGPDVRVRLHRPQGLTTKAPVVLHIHGGGYVFGSAELSQPRNVAWAKALGAVTVGFDYRLAPEDPHPAALNDSMAVLRWLHANADELDLDPDRVAVCGESAGGGLAAALCLLARETGGPKIVAQVLIYPMLDDRTGTVAEPNPFTGQFVWTSSSNAFAWSSLLGQAAGLEPAPYLAAPGRACDLSGLPPAMVATAALDIFVDEDLDYAKRLIRAGVPTEVYVAPGAFHGFDLIAPQAQVTKAFVGRCLGALSRAFGPPGATPWAA